MLMTVAVAVASALSSLLLAISTKACCSFSLNQEMSSLANQFEISSLAESP